MSTAFPQGPSRRRFLKLGGAGIALIPLVNLVGCSPEEPVRDPVEEPVAPPPPTPREPPPAAPASREAPGEYVILDESAPDAQALAYTHDAGEVDADAQPRYEPGQVCANCSLYQPRVTGEVRAEAGDDPAQQMAGWGGCTIFPGRLVNAAGWCSAWVPMV